MRKYKILIIEDDPQIRQIFEFKLSLDPNFNVSVAENGIEGLKQAKVILPDLVLLDLMMPEMNGDEVLEQMRSENWGASIRVIILTNLSKDEAPNKLRFLNVDRYVVKAHNTPTQVVAIVNEVLAK